MMDRGTVGQTAAMTYHVLNGDALVSRFSDTPLGGEMVIMRECLIEGDLSGDTLEEFYSVRANYLAATYGGSPEVYFDKVVPEFNKLSLAPNPSEFNLWFGYDLFCSVNMWFVISLLQDLPIEKQIYVVYPSHLEAFHIWEDFGGATPEQLLFCHGQRVLLTAEDLRLSKELWDTYRRGDLSTLNQLSKQQSASFPYLEEVCQAHINRAPDQSGKGHPERFLEELLEGPAKDFPSVFAAFSEKEGVYGFGDSQLRRIYDKVVQNR